MPNLSKEQSSVFLGLGAIVAILLFLPLSDEAPITPALCDLTVNGTNLHCDGIEDTYYIESLVSSLLW